VLFLSAAGLPWTYIYIMGISPSELELFEGINNVYVYVLGA
jgi:hypothetical protein